MNKDTWESLAEMGHSPKMIEAMLDEQEVRRSKMNTLNFDFNNSSAI